MERPSIKNKDQYKALKDQRYSKEKAARIANAENAGKKGGKASNYEDRTKDELYKQAKQLELRGRSKINKEELIKALRNN